MIGSRASVRVKRILIGAILTLAVIWSIGPVLWTLSTSLKEMEEVRQPEISYIPARPTIQPYIDLFEQLPYTRYTANSVVVSVISTLVIVISGALAGYTFSRFSFWGDIVLFFLILAVRIFPPISIIIPFFRVLGALNLLDTRLSLVLSAVYLNLPIVVWLLRGFFMTIPKDLDDAARVDGASRFGVFFRIALPLSLPGIAAASIFAFLHAWNDYLFPLVLTFSERAITLPLASYNFTSDVSVIWNKLAASSILTCIPAIIFTIFFQKWLISGLTKGAVKG